MESLFLLIPLAVLTTGIALKAFFWAVDNRQFEDLEQAGRGILLEVEPASDIDRADEPSTGAQSPGADR